MVVSLTGDAVAAGAARPRVPALAARDVTIRLGGALIVDSVSLDVHAGEIVALVGPNGAGKSTLLAALAGDLTLTTGTVEFGGTSVIGLSARAMARVRAVQVQDMRVAFAFTTEEVVEMGRAPWQGTVHQMDDAAVMADALERTATARIAAHRVPTLSGGELARTSFARVLVQETPVLLLDEPTAAMDLRFQELVLREVLRRAGAGVAVVVVLHDLSLASAYADRIVLLKDGRVRAGGEPRHVFTPELIEEVYDHPVTVLDHPNSRGLAILPRRTDPAGAAATKEAS